MGLYANTKSKMPEQLRKLAENGIAIAYMGLETGDDETLKNVRKRADADKMIRMNRKIREAGIKLSITVLLGIAGKDRSDIHARETGRVLTAIDPEYVGALSLMLIPGTPKKNFVKFLVVASLWHCFEKWVDYLFSLMRFLAKCLQRRLI